LKAIKGVFRKAINRVRSLKHIIMKTYQRILLSTISLITGVTSAQTYKDTIVEARNKKFDYEYDVKWSKERLSAEIATFKKSQFEPSFKASTQIKQILQQIKLSEDPCLNGGFEQQYNGWTGLSLKHGSTTLPIENGLILNPGIAPLPFTGTGSGDNYTSIESTGLDPIISVATPPYPLTKTAPGSTGLQSLRLGNDQPGFGAEGVAKRFVVTAENAKYYFQYAIVMDKSHSNADGTQNGSEVFFLAEAVTMSGTTVDKIVDVANPSNPFINAVNSGTKYYRKWRCAYLDLSSHIGQEVVVMFINSDCSAGAHKGYTYIDDVCVACKSNEGEIDLNLKGNDCIEEKNTFGGTFDVPEGAQNVNVSLCILQSNTVMTTLISPTILGSGYSFNVSPSDFPSQAPGTCYDLVAKLTFDLVDLNGNLQTVIKYSSKPVGGVQDGEIPGLNNDVCFCEDNKGAYCCDSENLVVNGNFEAGNSDFTSAYTQTATTFPGQYNVTTTAAAFGATVTDHSFCADPVMYASNNQFMVVNGKTQQGGTNIIWEQTISGLEKGERYKFCVNLKNMPQCTFDILPKVSLQAGSSTSGFSTVNVPASDPCAWQNETLNFTASGGSETVRIILDETGNGDGNDLVIDDVFVGQLGETGLAITVEHDGTNSTISGSVNTISTSDDTLHGNCTEYHWFVAEVTSFPSITVDFSTFAHGNGSGSFLPPALTPSPTPWNLSTTFPGYVFGDNKLYMIGMYTPECGCYDSGFTYQLTLNSKSARIVGLSEEGKQEIIDVILNGLSSVKSDEPVQQKNTLGVSVFPNPAVNQITVELSNDKVSSIQITDINGKRVDGIKFNGENSVEEVTVSKLPSGIYFIEILGISGNMKTKKIIKN